MQGGSWVAPTLMILSNLVFKNPPYESSPLYLQSFIRQKQNFDKNKNKYDRSIAEKGINGDPSDWPMPPTRSLDHCVKHSPLLTSNSRNYPTISYRASNNLFSEGLFYMIANLLVHRLFNIPYCGLAFVFRIFRRFPKELSEDSEYMVTTVPQKAKGQKSLGDVLMLNIKTKHRSIHW